MVLIRFATIRKPGRMPSISRCMSVSRVARMTVARWSKAALPEFVIRCSMPSGRDGLMTVFLRTCGQMRVVNKTFGCPCPVSPLQTGHPRQSAGPRGIRRIRNPMRPFRPTRAMLIGELGAMRHVMVLHTGAIAGGTARFDHSDMQIQFPPLVRSRCAAVAGRIDLGLRRLGAAGDFRAGSLPAAALPSAHRAGPYHDGFARRRSRMWAAAPCAPAPTIT